MTANTLRETLETISHRGTIRQHDLRAIRAACAEQGLAREDVAALARLDARLGGDEAFGDLLVELVVDAAVYGERPTGRIAPEAAAWLAATFGGGGCPHGGRVLVEVVRAAEAAPADLVEAAFRASKSLASWHPSADELRLAS